jgi:hypothetical protein
MAHSSPAHHPDAVPAVQDEDLDAVPEEFVITRAVRLTERGAATLRAELTGELPPPSPKLRALLRGVRR